MFTSQTSSFQESLDVDERDADFDNEEIAGYSQNIQQINSYYAIYYYQNTSLTLLDSSLPAEAEPELRSYISRRLSKGALLGGMGNIATVELSIPEQAVGCYCCLLEQEKSPEQPEADGNGWVVCLLGGSEKEVRTNLEAEVRPYLNRWYEESVMHIHRVVQLLQANVGYLLHAVRNHCCLDQIHLMKFIKAASLQGLVQEDTTAASLCKAISEDTHTGLIIDCSTSPPTLTNEVSNRFCDDWIQAFLNAAERFNPFLLRQILENFKLKAIQDMNNLKRFIRQAEMSHYALFRCCLFLQSCGNGDVLLQNARAEHSSLPEACGIITVLEEFLGEHAQGTLY
uniref:Chromosome 17 open reading frame 75 n=1 Tax=Cyprinus carpio TaxID=7962 RepID=A0A8C1UG79_CYPCA